MKANGWNPIETVPHGKHVIIGWRGDRGWHGDKTHWIEVEDFRRIPRNHGWTHWHEPISRIPPIPRVPAEGTSTPP